MSIVIPRNTFGICAFRDAARVATLAAQDDLDRTGGAAVYFDYDSGRRYAVGYTGFEIPNYRHDTTTFFALFQAGAALAQALVYAEGFGFWIDQGTLYIDAFRTFADVKTALAFAEANDQLAIYDRTAETSIFLTSRKAA